MSVEEKALAAIKEVFHDTNVSKEDTMMRLNRLSDELDDMVNSLVD